LTSAKGHSHEHRISARAQQPISQSANQPINPTAMQAELHMNAPLLDAAGIQARVPHRGRMCLLHTLRAWSPEHIECSAISHRDPHNPLRTQDQLLAVNAIEYAAQAMALHGSLCSAAGAEPTPGFLASVRNVTCHVSRLDAVEGSLVVTAKRLAGDGTQALYQFHLHDELGQALVEGRATVVLNALPRSSPTP
jgi:predicted hotdog family 3-hydroxylacyl-ACP dehydratase